MALNNPSSLFSGGNVRLDSTPYLRLALQERARKEARGYAIDQYYQKLPENINDKGVRNQEVPVIADLKNKMAETWINNRDALKRGDPNAQMKMQQLYRQAQQITRESQNASKIDMQLGTMALNKNNQDILNNDDFIQQHTFHNLPVNDPNYKPLDITQTMANRPFDPQSYAKDLKANVKYSEGIPTITPHPQDKNLEVVTTSPILDDQTKQNIYAGAAYKLHNDVSFQRSLQKNFATPEQIAPLNEISKKVFGHEIKEPEDIAAAYTASLLPSSTTRQSVRASIDAANKTRADAATLAFQRRKELAHLNDRLIKGRQKDGSVDLAQVGYPTQVLSEQYGEDTPLWDKATGKSIGNKRVVYIDKIPVSTLRTINPQDVNKGIYPVEGVPILQPDKKTYREGFYVDEQGNFIGRDGAKIGAEDARNLFIKEVVPTKVKLQINSNKPASKEAPKNASKWDKYKTN